MMKSILKKAILLAFVAAISMATFAQQKKPISTPPPKPTPYDEKQDEDLRKGLVDQEARITKITEGLADQEVKITKGLADQEVKITKGLADQEKRRALYAEGRNRRLDQHEKDIGTNEDDIAINTETLGKHETAIDGNTKAIAGNTNKLEKIDNVIDVKGKELHIIGSGLHVKKGTTVHMGMNQVHGVANGTNLYDAVNVSQLRDTETRLHSEINRVDKNASRGIAAAMASAGLNQASLPGKYMLSAGAASYRGKGALAVGFSTLSADGQWAFKGSVNANSKDAGVNLSVGYQW